MVSCKKLTKSSKVFNAQYKVKMLSWIKSTVYPETAEAPKPKGRKILVDEEFLDATQKLVNEQHERLKAMLEHETARAEALARLQGTLTETQKQILGATRSAELQKEFDANAIAAKKEYGYNAIQITREGLTAPHLWANDSSKILFTIDEASTIAIDVASAKKFYMLTMGQDGTTETVDRTCCLQVKDTEGEFAFSFPAEPWGVGMALKWFMHLDNLLKA